MTAKGEIAMRKSWITFISSLLLPIACFTALAPGQNPGLQQKVAEVKEASARNKQALAQYTWVEQVTISLKGEQKKQEHFQVRLGPDGKPQKTSLDPPQQPSAASGGGRRQGRLKEHVGTRSEGRGSKRIEYAVPTPQY